MRPVALITGASSGIGAEFARQLSARGYDLIQVARRAEISADLTTEEGLAKVERLIEDCPNLQLLVNNAGFGTLGRFWEADLVGQDAMHKLHVMATMRLCHAALKRMKTGGIINVSSVAAFSTSPGNASYCATKAWMNSFTEGLAVDLRSAGSPVRVQALCPGFTITEFHETLGVDRSAIPGWLWMTAEDVVKASLDGFDRGKLIVIPGWQYKATVILLRCLPDFIRRRLSRPFRDKRV